MITLEMFKTYMTKINKVLDNIICFARKSC